MEPSQSGRASGLVADRKLVVTIDGPAGAGKSTVAKRLAKMLGYLYMDTGAMYRAVALRAERSGIAADDEVALAEMVRGIDIRLSEKDGEPKVVLDGEDVTEEIRRPALSQLASRVSTVGAVRRRLVELQREMGRRGGVVAEGRDTGTVVFPDADLKVYLDAAPAERARRRMAELSARGEKVSLEETAREMAERDRRDRERDLSPLRRAADAVLIDSTDLGVDQVTERILSVMEQKFMAERGRNR
jgi:cytidylate kinase